MLDGDGHGDAGAAPGGLDASSRPSALSVLILGIGNILMGDEGIGVHVVRHLEKAPLPAGVECLDGGTGGFKPDNVSPHGRLKPRSQRSASTLLEVNVGGVVYLVWAASEGLIVLRPLWRNGLQCYTGSTGV